MPVIANGLINIDIRSTGIEILKEIKDCGCLKIDTIVKRSGNSKDEVRKALAALVGEGSITCDNKMEICCSDLKKLEEFSKKLDALKG